MAHECSIPYLKEIHEQFITKIEDDEETLEHLMGNYIRMGGAYWGLGTQALTGQLESSNSFFLKKKLQAVTFVNSCWDNQAGAYAPNKFHDAHVTSTLYAIMIYKMINEESYPTDSIVNWTKNLQNFDGSFKGDLEGEVDARFSYCACCILALLERLDVIDCDKAAAWIKSCQNPDGAFGSIPGAESHAAYTFCCVGALAILGATDIINRDKLGHWLIERQISGSCGGFNGRPEKAPDVCYSWWILASLIIIDRAHWIDATALRKFILACQDLEDGGIADRQGDIPDLFHTFFGTAALSLLEATPDLKYIHPVFALPLNALKGLV